MQDLIDDLRAALDQMNRSLADIAASSERTYQQLEEIKRLLTSGSEKSN